MTLSELESELPNGFHDAFIHDLRIDFVNGAATLLVALDFGGLDDSDQEDYRVGKLQIRGLCYCAIDPPDARWPWNRAGNRLGVYEDTGNPEQRRTSKALSETLPPGISAYQFYVDDYNSFLDIAAKDVHISWLDEGDGVDE